MALAINLEKLIKNEIVESERIEFKKGWNPEEILHTLCAFANDINNWGGGYILIGFDSEEGIPKLPPTGIPVKSIDSIQKKLVELGYKISPQYTPIVSPEKYQNKDILVIYAPGGDARPYKAPKNWMENNKVYWVRKGSCTVVAGSQDENKLIEMANKIPFDDRRNLSTSTTDLSLPLIQSFLREVNSNLYAQSGSISFEDLCRKINIAKGPTEDLHPVNVGLLMFSESPDSFFKGCKTEIVTYEDEVGDVFEETVLKGPIPTQIRNTLNYIKSSVIKEKVIKVPGKSESIRRLNYPYEALEEAVANAYYHRSYEDQRPIEINIRRNEIEIVSYPGPLPPLNKQVLKKGRVVARDYRNRRIGDFLKELKLTEGRGTGFPKIRKSMKTNGSPEAQFETDDDNSYFIARLPINPIFREIELTDYGRSILEFCKKYRTRRELLKHIGLKNLPRNSQRHLLPLINCGYIQYRYPELPNSSKQAYIVTESGLKALRVG